MKVTDAQLFNLPGQTPDIHPDAEQLALLLEPAIDPVERERLLDHLANCASCAAAMQLVMELENETSTLSEALTIAPQATDRQRNRWLFPLATAASLFACALLITSLLPGRHDQNLQTVRGSSVQLQPALGQVLTRQPETLAWQSTFEVPVYVLLMDGTARELWQSEPSELSSLPVPANLDLQPGTYFWQLQDSRHTVVAGPYWFKIE